MEKKWFVNVKGGSLGPFEISVVHKDNGFGIRSWGWFDDRKLLISHSGPGSNFVTVEVFKELLKAARRVAEIKNKEKVMIHGQREKKNG